MANAKVLGETLTERGFKMVSGGTDNHLLLVDLQNKEITGKEAEKLLMDAGITVNKNAVPNDPEKPFVTSGIRIGTPAVTTRGMKEDDMVKLGNIIADVIEKRDGNPYMREVVEMARKNPLYK